jgi:hypothetical protein
LLRAEASIAVLERQMAGSSHARRDGVPTVTVYDSLGTDLVQAVNVDSLKWRFFALGVRVGIALQMLLMCVLLMIAQKNEAVSELSGLYYPLFRGVFLLSFFGVLFAMMLFSWKRTGIDCARLPT